MPKIGLAFIAGLATVAILHAAAPVTALGEASFTAQLEIVATGAVMSYNVLYSKERTAMRVEQYDPSISDTVVAVIDIGSGVSYQWTVSKQSCAKALLPTPALLTNWDILTQVVTGLAGNGVKMNASSIRRMPVTVMGIDGYRWKTRPSNATTADIKWFFSTSPPWSIQGVKSPVVVAATVSAPSASRATQRFDVNFVNFFPAELPADGGLAFKALGTCNISSSETSAAPTTAAPAPIAGVVPMPALPAQFSATILTTMVDKQMSFYVYESFNGLTGNARLTLALPAGASAQFVTSVIVNNAFQLAYQVKGSVSTKSGVMWQALSADGTQKTRSVLSGATDIKCDKSIFADPLVGDVNNLLLVTQAGGPRYMGTATVRGIDAQYWEATFPNYKITWYFSVASWNVNGGTSTPLRMIISGRGQSPFFVHHPFLQRGEVVTDKMRKACEVGAVIKGNPQCDAGEDLYTHIHDFMGFVPRVDADEFGVPSVCQQDTNQQINSFPEAANCPDGMTSATVFVLCLLCAVFTGVTVGLVVYYRMKRKLIAVAGGELPPPVPA